MKTITVRYLVNIVFSQMWPTTALRMFHAADGENSFPTGVLVVLL